MLLKNHNFMFGLCLFFLSQFLLTNVWANAKHNNDISHSRGASSINLTITDVFPTADIEVNTPVAVRFSWTESDATGTVTVSSGSQSCIAILPIDSCVIFPDIIGLQTIMVDYSGDSTYPTESTSTDITTIERLFPQVVAFPDGSTHAWHTLGNDRSEVQDMSSDGRFILYKSRSDNLVDNDNNNRDDIFLFDRLNDTTELVSISDDEMPLNGSSFSAAMSDDGRFIAFASVASNAISDDAFVNGTDVFVRDRTMGTTTLINRTTTVDGMSEQGNGSTALSNISHDGALIVFVSSATNLDPLDTDALADVYVYNQFTQTLTLVSVSAAGVKGDGSSFNAMISGDGQRVAFESFANNLVVADQNNLSRDVFVKDLTDDSIELVNVLDTGLTTLQAFDVELSDISDDGNRIVIRHDDPNWFDNSAEIEAIYVRDISLAETYLVSQNNHNELTSRDISKAQISGNGQSVFMVSQANNLDSTYPFPIVTDELYRHDILVGTTQLINSSPLFYGIGSNNIRDLDVNSDGSSIAFSTDSNGLVPFDYNGETDAFYWQSIDQSIHAVSKSNGTIVGGQSFEDTESIATNFTGDVISFETSSNNFVSNDLNDESDAFFRDLNTGELLLISQANNGEPGNNSVGLTFMSDDGRYTIFESRATNLGWIVPPKISDEDLYRFDRTSGEISPISINTNGQMGNSSSHNASFSFDGRWVAFESSSSDLVDNDSNDESDIFIRDTWANSTERISRGITAETNDSSSYPDITPDGRYVVFDSDANNIVANDTNDSRDVFLYDRQLDTFTLISVDSNGLQTNDDSYQAVISADGNTVAFISDATNLDDTDTNDEADVYLHDLITGQTLWVSSIFAIADSSIEKVRISDDGRYIAYESFSANAMFNDFDNEGDVYIYDTITTQSRLATVNVLGENFDNTSEAFEISGNGRFLFFESNSENLINNSLNNRRDVVKAHNPFIPDAPIPASDAFEIQEDDVLMIDAPNSQTLSLFDNDSDPNGDVLSISSPLGSFAAQGLGGQVMMNADGSFSYTPPADQFDMAYFYYYVSDGVDEVPSFVTIDVIAANDPPSFNHLGDVMVDEDSGAYSQIWASDFSVGPDDESAQMLSSTTQVINTSGDLGFIQTPTIDAMGVLTFEAAADTVGQANIAYTLSDDGGGDDSTTVMFTITVNEVNDAPSFNGAGDIVVDEDSGLNQAIWASNIIAGPDSEAGQQLSSTTVIDNVTGNLSFVQAPEIDAAGQLTFEASPDTNGEVTITYTLIDDGVTNNVSSETFTIKVNEVNDAPSFNGAGNIVVDEDSGLNQSIWASNISPGPVSEASQQLSSTTVIDNVRGNLSFVQAPEIDAAGFLSFEASPDTNGEVTIIYTLMDDGVINNTASSSFTIIVSSVNDAPTFDATGDVTVNKDSGLYQQPWASNFSVGPANEAKQTLSVNTQIMSVSGCLSFSQAPQVDESGVLSFTPAIGSTGEAEIRFTLMDNGGDNDSTSEIFTIRVVDIIFANGFE